MTTVIDGLRACGVSEERAYDIASAIIVGARFPDLAHKLTENQRLRERIEASGEVLGEALTRYIKGGVP